MNELVTAPQFKNCPDQTDISEHMGYLTQLSTLMPLVVEVGCGHGNGSTRAFARGIEQSHTTRRCLISVDIDPARPEIQPACSFWHKVTGSSTSFYTVLDALDILQDSAADIIFIDTVHTKEQMEQELPVWAELSDRRTIWLFHDTYMNGVPNPMVDAIKSYCVRHPGWQYEEITKKCHGMGMMRYSI